MSNIYDAAYRCIIYTHYFEMDDKDIEDRKDKNKESKFWIAVQNTFANKFWLLDIDGRPDDINTLHMYKARSHHKLYEICLLDFNARND